MSLRMEHYHQILKRGQSYRDKHFSFFFPYHLCSPIFSGVYRLSIDCLQTVLSRPEISDGSRDGRRYESTIKNRLNSRVPDCQLGFCPKLNLPFQSMSQGSSITRNYRLRSNLSRQVKKTLIGKVLLLSLVSRDSTSKNTENIRKNSELLRIPSQWKNLSYIAKKSLLILRRDEISSRGSYRSHWLKLCDASLYLVVFPF